jgi:hypothetical protein
MKKLFQCILIAIVFLGAGILVGFTIWYEFRKFWFFVTYSPAAAKAESIS